MLLHGHALFAWIAAYLPLLLPLAVTVLSIFARAADIRSYESVLRISNDIAIGIISFDIWAVSVSRSDPTGRILVNSTTMISGDFVLPFLLAGLLVAVGCVVLVHYNFQVEETKYRWMLVGLVASILVYIAPFGVLDTVPQPTAEVRRYIVVIPYQDPGIVRVAPTVLRGRFFARFEREIEATSIAAAQEVAVQRFLANSESNQFKGKSGEKVVIQQENVLVIKR